MTKSFPIDLGTFPMKDGDSGLRNTFEIRMETETHEDVDLTTYGDTWTGQARRRASHPDAIDLIVDDHLAEEGVLYVSFPDEADLSRDLVFELEVTGGAIDPLTVFEGKFSTKSDVAK